MGNELPTTTARVVTVSATYGAAGSIIGPRLAAALGIRFVDRTVSSVAAIATESPSDAEQAAAPPSRWVSSLAQLASSLPGVPTASTTVGDPISDMRSEATNQVVAEAALGSVLILGRAAAVVLAEHPGTFHIRLDGPVEARIARGQQIEHIDAAEATRRCEVTDRLRALFVRRLYNRDANDLGLYHVVLDTTVFDEDDAVAVLQVAALKFWDRRAQQA